jgi:hypothetical protein
LNWAPRRPKMVSANGRVPLKRTLYKIRYFDLRFLAFYFCLSYLSIISVRWIVSPYSRIGICKKN